MTTPGNEWYFWIQVVIVPISMFLMVQMLRRLRSGDEKFEKQGEKLVELATQMKGVNENLGRQTKALDATMGKMTDIFVEGRGAVDKLAREVERDFVRKEEMQRLEQKTDDQHAEVMKAIAGLNGRIK